MKTSLSIVVLVLLATGIAQSADATDHARLEQLRVEFAAKWAGWRGPAYQAAIQATTGLFGEINADPHRQLMGIDEHGNPIIYATDNANAILTTRTNRVQPGGISGYDLTGSTIPGLCHWDNSTVNPDHPEFTGRIVNMDGGAHNEMHANHTGGTLIATGVNAAAKGMATAATLYSHDWDLDEAEIASAGANGAKLSSHSYHRAGGTFGEYIERTRSYDLIANAAPYYLMVLAAGNNGTWGWNTINSSNTAKNSLIVGGVDDVPNYTGPASVVAYGSSSRGPCDDNRIKPDIVGNAVDVFSCTADDYFTLSGTSMATPNVAGTAFLLVEHYYHTHNNTYPWSSTTKGVILHTANECGDWTGPDYRFGWGLMDAEAAADLIGHDGTVDNDVISELVLNSDQVVELPMAVVGDEPLRVTICWNDPAADVGAAVTLINDLDIQVTELATDISTLPWVLNGNTNGPATRGDNDVDNVEMVYIADPTPGNYLLTVSHEGPLQGGSQPYSLIVTGAIAGDLPEATLTLTPISTFIMPGGGPLIYGLDFTYFGDSPRPNSSYWVEAILPNGATYGPVFQFNTTFMPGQHVATQLTHLVPGSAPGGSYTITGYVGTYPDLVIASDEFGMVKFGGAASGGMSPWQTTSGLAAEGAEDAVPAVGVLSDVYPNPFNPTTTIRVELLETADLNVAVFNIAGQQVETLAEGSHAPGQHSFLFDGTGMASGIYFVQASIPGELNTMHKIMLVK